MKSNILLILPIIALASCTYVEPTGGETTTTTTTTTEQDPWGNAVTTEETTTYSD